MGHDPLRIGVSGPLEGYARGFALELAGQGYLQVSATLQMQLVADLSCWLDGEGLDAGALDPVVVERYMAARRVAGPGNFCSAKALAPLVEYLRGLGVLAPAAPIVAVSAVDVLLARFREYLIVERGLAVGTVVGYLEKVRPFVAGRVRGDDGLDLEGLTAADVSAFVLEVCPLHSVSTAKLTVTALRSLLGFLHVEGVLEHSLAWAAPAAAGWRLAGLPKALESGQVRGLLTSCDRRTAAGRRDFAILMLLWRLGLRRGEVAALQLEDLDWRAGELIVRGKGDRHERLPLPGDVGQALAGYLHRGRPRTAVGRNVFIRVLAPHRALSAAGVTGVVIAAGRRSGLEDVTAHRLRHTAATEMLRAGATLPQIGQVLRHRQLLTTAIYAKVDREALRGLARPWPTGSRS
jgi:site-specific recombinase XerD